MSPVSAGSRSPLVYMPGIKLGTTVTSALPGSDPRLADQLAALAVRRPTAGPAVMSDPGERQIGHINLGPAKQRLRRASSWKPWQPLAGLRAAAGLKLGKC